MNDKEITYEELASISKNKNYEPFDFHLEVKKRLIEDKNTTYFIPYKEARTCLQIFFHINKQDAKLIFKDMKNRKLLKFSKHGLFILKEVRKNEK